MEVNVLVTGSGGFIGSYLTSELVCRGYNVIRHRSQDGNLLCVTSLDKYENVDVVYHLAGRTYVPESWERPDLFIDSNISILLNVLEYCKKRSCKLVFVSTYLYGEPMYLPIDEKHKCVASSPYHLSKKLGEEICEFYNLNFNMDIAVVRPFNVYGKGQNEEFLLPKIIRQVVNNEVKTIEVFDLNPRRDYIYVEDIADILVRLLPHIKGFDVYNVGSGISYSVKDVIDIIQSEFGTDKPVVEKKSFRRNEIMDCYADTRHIESIIGGLNITPIAEGIHKWRVMEYE